MVLNPVRIIMLIGSNGAVFGKNAAPQWGTAAIKTLFRFTVAPSAMVAVVTINKQLLLPGDYNVRTGGCTGTLSVKP